MRTFSFATFYLAAVAVTAYFAGFQKGVADVTPVAGATENPVIINAPELNVQLNQAASILINCGEFRAKHPTRIQDLRRFGTVQFAYIDKLDSYLQHALAITIAEKRIILLTPAFFTLNYEQQRSILGHEMLHIIGIPSSLAHNTEYVNVEKDEVYRLTFACFDDVP